MPLACCMYFIRICAFHAKKEDTRMGILFFGDPLEIH